VPAVGKLIGILDSAQDDRFWVEARS
jgi:hypothetical protein